MDACIKAWAEAQGRSIENVSQAEQALGYDPTKAIRIENDNALQQQLNKLAQRGPSREGMELVSLWLRCVAADYAWRKEQDCDERDTRIILKEKALLKRMGMDLEQLDIDKLWPKK